MKVLLWLLLILLIPLSAWSQSRLFLRATVPMPMSGSSDFKAYLCHGSGAFDDNAELKFQDSIPILAGDNQATLSHTLLTRGNTPYSAGLHEFRFQGLCTFQFNPQNHTLLWFNLSGGNFNAHFSISLDTVRVVALSDSTWTLDDQSISCTYTCDYVDRYLMPNGNNGKDVAQGKGQTTFAGRNVLLVLLSNEHSSIRISSIANGVIQIEGDVNKPGQEIEIFDALGRQVFHTAIDGQPIRVGNLRMGCYFARTRAEVRKFVVVD